MLKDKNKPQHNTGYYKTVKRITISQTCRGNKNYFEKSRQVFAIGPITVFFNFFLKPRQLTEPESKSAKKIQTSAHVWEIKNVTERFLA